MGLERTRRIELLAERPPLTGTRWDALLPAVVEHTSVSCTSSSRRGGARAGAIRRHPGLLRAGSAPASGNRDLRAGGVHPARRARECARRRRARRRTACLDPRITAGSESFSMSCRRRSTRAATSTSSSSAARHGRSQAGVGGRRSRRHWAHVAAPGVANRGPRGAAGTRAAGTAPRRPASV